MQRSHSLTDSQFKDTCLKNIFGYFFDAMRIGLFMFGVLVDVFTDSLVAQVCLPLK